MFLFTLGIALLCTNHVSIVSICHRAVFDPLIHSAELLPSDASSSFVVNDQYRLTGDIIDFPVYDHPCRLRSVVFCDLLPGVTLAFPSIASLNRHGGLFMRGVCRAAARDNCDSPAQNRWFARVSLLSFIALSGSYSMRGILWMIKKFLWFELRSGMTDNC